MNSPFRTACAILAVTTTLAMPARAHAHGAHVHGEAEMSLVIEDASVSITVFSPMHNITGFEHAPETEAERASLREAISTLEDGATLFVTDEKAECELQSVEHNLALSGEEPSGHEHEQSHHDLEARYDFTCKRPARLSFVEVELFSSFENLEKIDAIVLRGNRQLAQELRAENNRLAAT